ncbi:MAG: biotin/lipoyl-binding protein, partial [Nevskiales bacterium]
MARWSRHSAGVSGSDRENHGRWAVDRYRLQGGQSVHVGDVLARIDPRVYQAALDNAVAKQALDEATLANARLD